jgi:arylsulfatase A-like enzyme
VNTPEKGIVGIPFVDEYVEKDAIAFLEDAAKDKSKPFFINVNFMKNHQPNLPAPEFEGKSISKSKYADSVVELDTRIGRVLDKLDELGLKDNTIVFYTVDNGAWQDVYPDAGYTPFRGTKGTVREGGSRVPTMVRWPGHVKPGSKSDAITGGLDLMATFASVAGIKLPEKDREGQPIIFDSKDMTPVWTGKGKPLRNEWFYYTEDELSPGAIRVGNWKYVFNLRGDDGAQTGALAVDTNLGWKGAKKYAAVAPQIFDLLADPQERYDIFMTTYTESTWTLAIANELVKKKMESYVKYPPRKLQSKVYTGPITLTQYQRFKYIRDSLEKDGFDIGLPSGN